jgi:hypothetical protein
MLVIYFGYPCFIGYLLNDSWDLIFLGDVILVDSFHWILYACLLIKLTTRFGYQNIGFNYRLRIEHNT